jgi:hypothetical protein
MRGRFQFFAADTLPTMGEIVFGALTAGLPAAVLLVTLDIPNRKFRYQLKWVFVSLLLANLAGIAAARLLSYSGVLVR